MSRKAIILLPNTSSCGACLISQRILDDMASVSLSASDEEQVSLSLSAGVATLAIDDDENALFRKADDALYQAKSGGRNRVECAGREPLQALRPDRIRPVVT